MKCVLIQNITKSGTKSRLKKFYAWGRTTLVFPTILKFYMANFVSWITSAPKCWLPERVNLGENPPAEKPFGLLTIRSYKRQNNMKEPGKNFICARRAFRLLKTHQWRFYYIQISWSQLTKVVAITLILQVTSRQHMVLNRWKSTPFSWMVLNME